MKIAIDISPIKDVSLLAHRVRGTGFYIENLKEALLEYFPQNQYTFFTQQEKVPQGNDLVHYPYFEPFFLSLPLRISKKRIVTVHDLTPLVFPEYFPTGIKGKIRWWLQRRSLKKTDAIITDSACSKSDILKYTGIPSEKLTVVYLSAGQEFKQLNTSDKSVKQKIQDLKKKYHLPSEFVLYVGDATWNKNLPRLIQAIEEIDVPLVLVGKAIANEAFDKSNPWNQDLVTIQKHIKSNKKIISLGFVSSEDLVLLYNVATVFCMPSLYEGFGLPLLEAMSCGCPAISTREGSLAEIGGEAVLYVDAYSSKNIAAGIRKLMQDISLQKELIKKGLLQSSLFSWKKTAEETVKVYEKVFAKE